MTNFTPETLESIPPDNTQMIRDVAADLHQGVPVVLGLLHPKDVEEQKDLRSAIILKMREAESEIGKQVANLNALKKDLSIRRGYAQSDKQRIESHLISLFVAQKELRNRP